jgi:hypothetical protein
MPWLSSGRQVVAGLGAVPGGHEPEVEVVRLQVLQLAAEADVAQPVLVLACGQRDVDAGPVVDLLVDGDDVLAQHEFVGDPGQLAAGVVVLPGGKIGDLPGVGLDVDVE